MINYRLSLKLKLLGNSELRITCSHIKINYQLPQKLELLGNGKSNHLTKILTCKN
jgi:hypothetical protein